MTFSNAKRTFLTKLDRSKKGSIDLRAIPIIQAINQTQNYYTTSSCSGRVYFWTGTGKKNQTTWVKVSHDLIDESFFALTQKEKEQDQIWLRCEPFIIHIACKDIQAANALLKNARLIFKKSSILTASSKVIVEIRDSSMLEMPFYSNSQMVFSGDFAWLTEHINTMLEKTWEKTEILRKKIKENFL